MRIAEYRPPSSIPANWWVGYTMSVDMLLSLRCIPRGLIAGEAKPSTANAFWAKLNEVDLNRTPTVVCTYRSLWISLKKWQLS